MGNDYLKISSAVTKMEILEYSISLLILFHIYSVFP